MGAARRVWGVLGLVLALLLGGGVLWVFRPGERGNPAEVGAALRQLAGARVRVVWCQDVGAGTDTFATGKNLLLMGMDSNDGRGPHPLLEQVANYAKPLIVPGGDRVVFSDRTSGQVYVVNWDGSDLRRVCPGFAVHTWADPKDDGRWVYVAQDEQPGQFVASAKFATVRRYRLDAPEVNELIWNKTLVGLDSFQVSADGRRAAFLFPWPEAGVAELPNGKWTKYGEGCWTALAPDDSYRLWVFDGPHRNITLYDKEGTAGHLVNINGAPGVNGYEVYHPRWSNHVRVLAVSGPYVGQGGGNNVHRGGKEVEIYVGRFDVDLSSVESWVQITHNRRADFYPDVWVDTDSTLPVKLVRGTQAMDGNSTQAVGLNPWPVNREKLLFIWEDAAKTNRIDDAETGGSRQCRVEPHGRAKFARYHLMDPAGGFFMAQGFGQSTAGGSVQSGDLSVEATVWPGTTSPASATVLWMGDGQAAADLQVVQETDHLVAYVRTAGGRERVRIDVGQVQSGNPTQLLLTYEADTVRCYRNGALAASVPIAGNLNAPKILVCGADARGDHPWEGQIEGIAVHARVVSPAEAQARYEAYSARFQQRTRAARSTVRAKLVESSAIPTPQQIAPYRRALVANEYQLESVISGPSPGARFLTAHWVILDAASLPEASRKKGDTFVLTLEKFDDHAELKGERMAMDSENFDLPLFYDLGDGKRLSK